MEVLVTGAGGFLGGAVMRALAARGDGVRVLCRRPLAERPAAVQELRGDLTDAEAVRRAVEGCRAVVHCAAKPGHWGDPAEYYASNVLATERLLAAARAAGVERFVYTSTPSVVHAGADIEGGDEALPYAARYLAEYPRTKMLAERAVLAANGPDFATCALRPHLIWGPGDNHLFPRIVARARAGRLRLVGPPECTIDTVYIDNAVQAHLAALDRSYPGAACAGRAYFISNDEPIRTADMVNRLLEVAGLPPVRRRIPRTLAYAVGALLEAVYRGFGLGGEPLMTRFLAEQLGTSHWFDISAAKRDLGYRPEVSLAEGFTRLRRALEQGGRPV